MPVACRMLWPRRNQIWDDLVSPCQWQDTLSIDAYGRLLCKYQCICIAVCMFLGFQQTLQHLRAHRNWHLIAGDISCLLTTFSSNQDLLDFTLQTVFWFEF